MIMYGIPNCDTIKKARRFLQDNKISYEFHDYKKQGITSAKLKAWCKIFGHETLLNRRGTTWRKLDEETRANMNQTRAIEIMQEQPSIIKRPVLENGDTVLLGFELSEYKSLL